MKYKLFPTCILVKGGAYSAIYDLDRNALYRFKSENYKVIETFVDGVDVDTLSAPNKDIYVDIQRFLRKYELGLYLDNSAHELIAKLPVDWSDPSEILDSIIDIDKKIPDLRAIFDQLEGLGCRAVHIRSYSDTFGLENLDRDCGFIRTSSIGNVVLLLKWTPACNGYDFASFFSRYSNVSFVDIHSAPFDSVLRQDELGVHRGQAVRIRCEEVESSGNCGSIELGTMNEPSARTFACLSKVNGCLNRKVSVDKDGNLCNCPSMPQKFGKDIQQMRDLVKTEKFREFWYVTKDRVDVCRSCEYRYVCTDCRAYLGEKTSTAKPAKCRYDPELGVWN